MCGLYGRTGVNLMIKINKHTYRVMIEGQEAKVEYNKKELQRLKDTYEPDV